MGAVTEPSTGESADAARGTGLSHLGADGRAQMVDVSEKHPTARAATATGAVQVSQAVVDALGEGSVAKGDVLGVARIAAIQAAKRTWDLIPLCHQLPLTGIDVGLELRGSRVEIDATVRTTAVTGVEMEALTAVAVAGLTVIDMVKALDPQAVLTDIGVQTKTGGVGGTWVRQQASP